MPERPDQTAASEPDRRPAAVDAGDDAADDATVDETADETTDAGDSAVPREELERALAAAATGDERAWRWIVDTYARRVFGLLYAQCGEAETCDELTQSTFCTVVAKIGEYSEQGRFEAWLFRIAMNRLRDEMRRRRRHATPVEHDTLAGLVGGESGAARGGARSGGGTGHPVDTEGFGDADDVHALREAMARLPDADRRVLHLRHAAGMSFKGIAEFLDQPLGTVLARHHRALRKLREDLGPRFEPPEPSEAAESPPPEPEAASDRDDAAGAGGRPEGGPEGWS